MTDRKRRCRRVVLARIVLAEIICGLPVGAGSAHAQTVGASLQGIVTDPSGAALPNADVIVISVATGARRPLRSRRHLSRADLARLLAGAGLVTEEWKTAACVPPSKASTRANIVTNSPMVKTVTNESGFMPLRYALR